LPAEFWTRPVDTLPTDQVPKPDVNGQPSDRPEGVSVRRESFWTEPPATSPSVATGAAAAEEVTGATADLVQPTRALNFRLGTNVTITIEGFDRDRLDEPALSQLAPALEGLRAALIKIGVVEGLSRRPATKPSPQPDGHSSSMN
jgi:hypothetical protein